VRADKVGRFAGAAGQSTPAPQGGERTEGCPRLCDSRRRVGRGSQPPLLLDRRLRHETAPC